MSAFRDDFQFPRHNLPEGARHIPNHSPYSRAILAGRDQSFDSGIFGKKSKNGDTWHGTLSIKSTKTLVVESYTKNYKRYTLEYPILWRTASEIASASQAMRMIVKNLESAPMLPKDRKFLVSLFRNYPEQIQSSLNAFVTSYERAAKAGVLQSGWLANARQYISPPKGKSNWQKFKDGFTSGCVGFVNMVDRAHSLYAGSIQLYLFLDGKDPSVFLDNLDTNERFERFARLITQMIEAFTGDHLVQIEDKEENDRIHPAFERFFYHLSIAENSMFIGQTQSWPFAAAAEEARYLCHTDYTTFLPVLKKLTSHLDSMYEQRDLIVDVAKLTKRLNGVIRLRRDENWQLVPINPEDTW